uniref:glucuronosyltransferase n=1 Tax=Romanomermis culicivorax TaxID=13658 RepID=A0A915JWK9_ROMCU
MIPLAKKLDVSRRHQISIFMESPVGQNLTFSRFGDVKIVDWPVKMYPEYHRDIENFRYELFWGRPMYKPQDMLNAWKRLSGVTRRMLNENFTEFKAQILDQKWDLVISDSLTITGLMISLFSNASLAVLHPSVPYNVDLVRRSIPDAWSYTPAMFVPKMTYDHRNLFDRVSTLWTDLMDVLVSSYADYRIIVPRFRPYHNGLSLHALSTTSNYFLYTHTEILDYSKPVTHDTISMGSSCNYEPVHLDPDLQTFIEDPSSKGTILVAFWHYIDWNNAPNSTLSHILSTLQRFPQYRIVLQFDYQKIGGHLWSAKWVPQQSLLNHPSTKLFVNHGGMKTLSETTCAGVPQIVVPFFYDQNRNGLMVEKSGCGRTFDKTNLITGRQNLGDLIQSILINDTYRKNAQRIKKLLIDRPMEPLDYEHRKLCIIIENVI